MDGGDPAAICGGNSAVFKRLLNISPSAFAVCYCFVSVLCYSAIPAGAAWPMMTGGPRPGCAAAAPGPGCGRQAGGQVLGGGVAEKAAASLGMGGEYSHILPRTLPGYRKTWRRVLWNPGRKLSGAYSWLSKFQVFINLVLNGTCGILIIDRTIRIHVRRCSRCLARRRKAVGRAADHEIREVTHGRGIHGASR